MVLFGQGDGAEIAALFFEVRRQMADAVSLRQAFPDLIDPRSLDQLRCVFPLKGCQGIGEPVFSQKQPLCMAVLTRKCWSKSALLRA